MSNLPKGWEIVPLGKLGRYINGRAFKPTEWETVGLPIIRIQNLTKGSATTNYYSKPVKDKYYIRDGDLLVSWSATLGAYIWQGGDAILNQHIFKVEANEEKVDKVFLKFTIEHAVSDLMKVTHGSTMRHVTKGVFEAHKVLIPKSKVEQQRIVNVIEALLQEVREMREIQQEVSSNTDRLLTAFVDEVFLEGIKDGWIEQTIHELVAEKPQYGSNQKANTDSIGLPVLRMGNIQDGELDFTKMKHADVDDAEKQKYLLNHGDIVFNRTNSAEHVGKSAVFEADEDMIFASYLIRVVIDRTKADPKFVTYFINSSLGRKYIDSQYVRAIGQVNVNATKMQGMSIPIPDSVEVQKSIVIRLNQIRQEVKEMQKMNAEELERIDQLEKSILAQAFRGEL